MLLTIRDEDFDTPGLRSAWNALSQTAPAASLFSTCEWCRCWAETVGQDMQPAILRWIDDRGATVGLAPLCTRGQGAHRRLQFMGRERASGDHLDILWAEGISNLHLEALVSALDDALADCGGLLLGELPNASPTRAALLSWARKNAYPWREQEHRRIPYLDLPADFDTLLAGLSPKMRFQVRRQRRLLARLTGGRIYCVRSGNEIETTLAAFFDLHRRRWEEAGICGNYAREDLQAFLRSFAALAAERDWLRLHVLEIAGRPDCILIAFHWRGTACYYQMGRNPESPLESPGVALVAASIETAISEGLTRYDLLQGDEAYKSRWTTQAAEASTLVIGRSRAARAAIRAEQIKDALKRTVFRCLGQQSWERAQRLWSGLAGARPESHSSSDQPALSGAQQPSESPS